MNESQTEETWKNQDLSSEGKGCLNLSYRLNLNLNLKINMNGYFIILIASIEIHSTGVYVVHWL